MNKSQRRKLKQLAKMHTASVTGTARRRKAKRAMYRKLCQETANM